MADAQKPYAHLFTDADREHARIRLEPHKKAIELRRARSRDRAAVRKAEQPDGLVAHPKLAGTTTVRGRRNRDYKLGCHSCSSATPRLELCYTQVPVVAIIGIGIVVALIIWRKMDAFLVLTIGALFVGVSSGIALAK